MCIDCDRSQATAAPTGGDAHARPAASAVIGDITVGSDGVIRTPAGSAQLRGSVWSVSEHVTERQYIAQSTIIWAIVLSLFCGLGLLLLLKKEHELTGTADVTVVSGPLRHRTTIAISDRAGLDRIRAEVAELQQRAGPS